MRDAHPGITSTHLVALVLLSACGTSDGDPSTSSSSSAASSSSSSTSSGTGGGGGDEGPVAGVDATVKAFDRAPIYFTGGDDKRTVDVPVAFPADGVYEHITLHLSLECPTGGCDPWDRLASLGVVTQKGADVDADTVVEIQRFITPYGVGAQWALDVTDMRPLLTGAVTLRAFIDTWVGPGSPYGDGWLLSASFEMKGGVPAKLPAAIVPVWPRRAVVYGDPAKPITMSAPPQTLALPNASSYALRTFVTGHGQGNADNCAEFCPREHTISAGATPHTTTVWRTDCATTAAPGQQGTWKYPRAGWCPGADVRPWVIDVTADTGANGMATFAYDVQAYDNTCRPDVNPCTGCTLGTGCAYDGGAHTEPSYSLSAILIAYR